MSLNIGLYQTCCHSMVLLFETITLPTQGHRTTTFFEWPIVNRELSVEILTQKAMSVVSRLIGLKTDIRIY